MKLRETAFFLLLITFYGCNNIFNPTDVKYGKIGADGYIDEGEKRVRTGEYAKAMTAFTRASTMDPAKSEAWYGIAKVSFIQVGFNIITLVNSFDNSSASLPFVELTMQKQDSLYVACKTAKIALGHILDTLHSDKVIKPEWIKLDYATILSIYTVLRLLDFNMDGRINDADNLMRLLQLKVDAAGFHMANFDALVSTPDGRAAFNSFLDYASGFIAETSSEVSGLFTGRSSSLPPQKFENVISTMANQITYYKVGDCIDNDNDGRIDEEIRNNIDDDGDGRVDEDTKIPGTPKLK